RLVLAGDVGGTKILLGIFREEDSGPKKNLTLIREARFPTADFPSLEAVCGKFLAAESERPTAACFGVPGPVIGGNATASNIKWQMSEKGLSAAVAAPVRLINDLGAAAYGVINLPDTDSVVLNHGASLMYGNVAVIAAGTGL